MKNKVFKNGAWVHYEKSATSYDALYIVKIYDPMGHMRDKVRCDSYRDAMDFYRSFCAIAKNY